MPEAGTVSPSGASLTTWVASPISCAWSRRPVLASWQDWQKSNPHRTSWEGVMPYRVYRCRTRVQDPSRRTRSVAARVGPHTAAEPPTTSSVLCAVFSEPCSKCEGKRPQRGYNVRFYEGRSGPCWGQETRKDVARTRGMPYPGLLRRHRTRRVQGVSGRFRAFISFASFLA